MAKNSSFVFFDILDIVSPPSPIRSTNTLPTTIPSASSFTDKAEFESFIPNPIAIGKSVSLLNNSTLFFYVFGI